MKAKSNFSQLVAQSSAKASLALFAGITIFIGGFVTWSLASLVGGIVS